MLSAEEIARQNYAQATFMRDYSKASKSNFPVSLVAPGTFIQKGKPAANLTDKVESFWAGYNYPMATPFGVIKGSDKTLFDAETAARIHSAIRGVFENTDRQMTDDASSEDLLSGRASPIRRAP